MHQLIPPTQRLVPLAKEFGPILLPKNGKMVPHIFSKYHNRLIPNERNTNQKP